MINSLRNNINKYFVGKEAVVDDVLICLLAGGHILIEDAPGLGKTTLASALAHSINCSFGRIQCTPDTLPGDITGVSVYNQQSQKFEYMPGVVVNQLLLADEINRATPKTQSSLLEAMEEKQVTVDGNVYKLPEPFMVIATQNPVEYVGTYPLPEAQIDRFMMRLSIGYPSKEQELDIAKRMLAGVALSEAEAVCSVKDIMYMKQSVTKVTVSDAILSYVLEIIRSTRLDDRIVTGASPRAMLALIKASQARTYIMGREYVKPDDVKAVVTPVLMHRLNLTSQARAQKEDIKVVFQSIISKVRVPV